MKHSKLLLVVAVLAFALSMFAGCTNATPHNHEYSAWELVNVPTFTDAGSAKRQCTTCEDVDKDYVPALTDTSVWTLTTIDPTHTELGANVYTSKYGTIKFDIEKLEGHEFGDWVITVAPTADAEGTALKVCPCGEEESTAVPALSDTTVWSVEVTDATHLEEGLAVYTSATYGVVEVVLAKDPTHAHGDWTLTVNPTETAVGTAVRTCACGHEDSIEVAVLGDTTVWSADVTPSTHFEEGLAVYTSVYGTVEVVLAKDADAHVWGAWSIKDKPVGLNEGLAIRHCECGDSEEIVIPNTNDTSVWSADVTPATHYSEGLIVYTSIYGTVEVVLVKLTNHEYGDWTLVTAPTLEDEGLATRACPCEHVDEVVVPALSNATVWAVESQTAADYNNAGEATYVSEYGSVTVTLAKLVAPYDNKTYANVHYDAELSEDYYKNGVVGAQNSWVDATITLDANGAGLGSAYPFRGFIEFSVVNATTGEIVMKTTGFTTNDDGEVVPKEDEVTYKTAYVDFETGLIVIPHGSKTIFNAMLILTPFGKGVNTDDAVATSVASAWDNTLAIDYNVIGGANHSIFIHKEHVYFGVSFVDANGDVIAANECYNAPYVKVLDRNGKLIEAFVFNGEKLVISDKYEGTYAGAMGEAVASGLGTITISGLSGTYEIIDTNLLGVYVNGEYYEATISGNTYTLVKPMVDVAFNAGEYASVDAVRVNKNIAYTLPVLDHETHTFKGWFYDANFTKAVGAEFVPTADCTLYALWAEKVVVYLDGVLDGDATVIYLGDGDVIGDFLPEYGVVTEIGKMFVGWVIIIDGEEVDLPLEAEIAPEDSGITVYAKWADIPAYVGTYYGTELYNAGLGNGGGKTLTIDANGKITGLKTGTILSYDPATQVVTYTTTGTDTKVFYFNEELGVAVVPYYSSSTSIDNDFYFLTKKTATNGKVNAHYGVKAAKNPGDSSRGWYAHLINAETDLGTREVFLYNNYIYTNFTAVDGLGEPVLASTVKNSKILVVKDANGNIIVSVASKGNSFDANKDTIDLDAYFGTYVSGDSTVVLDGTGVISFDGVTGTYALAVEGSAYQFDVYLANNTEYYELTLDGDTFTAVKPMVTITYEEGEYASLVDVTVNKNITVELPHLVHADYMFNGWFYDAECTSPVGTVITPTADVTIHALWKVKKVLTIVYNNGEENSVVEYSLGDVVTVDMPVYTKHAFVGWYTTATFDAGSEWTSGAEIDADVTIYAKWEDAYAFYNTYTITRLTDTNLTGTGYTYCYKNYSTGPYIFDIDAQGNGVGTSNPFNGKFTVENFNPETGYLEIVYIDSYNTTNVYRGYLDNETGFIVTEYVKDKGLNQVFFFNPLTTDEVTSSNISNTYWNHGKSRAIQYTYAGVTYSIFVHNDMVYYGVEFKDVDGNAVAASKCKDAATLYVYAKDGSLIAKFAHDGSSLQPMDGYEGTYAGANAVVVDGVKTITIDGVTGEYAHVEGADFTVEAYVGGSYYEVTLSLADYSAVVVKPMVTVTYDCGEYDSLVALVTNKNIEATLSEPYNDAYTFRGWFFDAEYTKAVPANFVPTEDVTLYAKWAEKVVLTIVYGNGLDNATFDYSVGDTISLVVPGETNGLYFEGWYADAEFTVPFTQTVIDGATTVYCNWTDVLPFGIEQFASAYAMVYDASTGAWTNTNQGIGSSSSGLTISATVMDIEITFDWSVSSESNWDALYVYANGQEMLNKSSGSGEKSGTITVVLRAGNTLQLYYKKDSSGNKGTDTVTITNLTVAGVAVTEVA